MPHLGDLERAVMTVLWTAGGTDAASAGKRASAGQVTAKAVCDALGDRTLAVTTVLTVLSRLERKGLVRRSRDDRAHTYSAVATREEHVAELMREALGTADDRDGALVRFVGTATDEELDALRRALRTRRRA